MIYLSDEDIDRLIREDAPYIDLTTLVLGIGGQQGKIRYYCRDRAVVCGTEEALRVFGKLGVQPIRHVGSGTPVQPGELILEAGGRAENLHMAWKAAQNILEYCSGIATRTRNLVDRAAPINPGMTVVATRKIFPGTKSLAIKAVIAGGGYPHRLGLSETLLVFGQHLAFCGGLDGLISMIAAIKTRACEKKLIVEVESPADAIRLCQAGVDGIQFDKASPQVIGEALGAIRNIDPGIAVMAAGGINESNIEDYARTGIDAVVTTSVYFGRPVDIGVSMSRA